MPSYPSVIETSKAQPAPRPIGALVAAPLASACLFLLVFVGGLMLGAPLELAARWAIWAALVPIAMLLAGFLLPLAKWLAVQLAYFMERETGHDITGDGYIGQPLAEKTVEYLPVRGQAWEPHLRLAGSEDPGYTRADFRALLEHAYGVDHTVRSFLGMELPSGRRVNGQADLAEFYSLLERAQFLTGRVPGHAGQLLGDVDEALRHFKLV